MGCSYYAVICDEEIITYGVSVDVGHISKKKMT